MIITLREKSIEEKETEIMSRYKPKLDSYRDLIIGAIAADGATQAVKVANFSAKYNALLVQQNNELEELYL